MSKRMTTQEFIEQAKLVHGIKYGYEKVNYVNNHTPITITCPVHGDFEQTPSSHLCGHGCRKCAGNKKLTTEEWVANAKRVHGERFDYSSVEYKNANSPITIKCNECGAIIKTTPHSHLTSGGCVNCRKIKHTRTKESFIQKAVSIHGNKYKYDEVEYVHGETKVKIFCPEHGYFLQTPNSHLQGAGCPTCAKIEMAKNATLTKEEFVIRAVAVHGDKYDYTDTVYTGTRNKVRIWCNQHKGYFEQCAATHLSGEGCPICGGSYSPTTEEFIEMCISVHGNKYGYDKTVYVNSTTPVTITCPIHGDFEQVARAHARGAGCPLCGRETQRKKMSHTKEEFIEKAKKAHSNEDYDYSKVEYINSYTPVVITCPTHGDFVQKPCSHLSGCGCPSCQRSMGELKIIEILDKYKIAYCKQYKIHNEDLLCRTSVFKCDFYIESKKCVIEFNGKQHYEASEFFGGEKTFERQQERDLALKSYCKRHKIKFIEIPYNEYNNIEKILKKELKIKSKT